MINIRNMRMIIPKAGAPFLSVVPIVKIVNITVKVTLVLKVLFPTSLTE
jgi:hypothetical protein